MLLRNIKNQKICFAQDTSFIGHNSTVFIEDGSTKLHLAIHRLYYLSFIKSEKFIDLINLLDNAIIDEKVTGFKLMDYEMNPDLENVSSSLMYYESYIEKFSDLSKKELFNLTKDEKLYYENYFSILPINHEYFLNILNNEINLFKNKMIMLRRNYSNPIIIYLPKIIDDDYIIALCNKLEKILKDIIIDENSLHELIDSNTKFPHISLRNDRINGKYVSLEQASVNELKQLKEMAENNSLYLKLKNNNPDNQLQNPRYSPIFWTTKSNKKKEEKNYCKRMFIF